MSQTAQSLSHSSRVGIFPGSDSCSCSIVTEEGMEVWKPVMWDNGSKTNLGRSTMCRVDAPLFIGKVSIERRAASVSFSS